MTDLLNSHPSIRRIRTTPADARGAIPPIVKQVWDGVRHQHLLPLWKDLTMVEALVVCWVVAWFVRVACEDGFAAVRGTESPRATRRRERQEAARAAGAPTIGQAAAARIATAIAPKPGQPRRRPALEYLRARWEDAWDELLQSHNEEVRRRAQERRDRQERDAERKRRENAGTADPYDDIVDAEIVDDLGPDPDPVDPDAQPGSEEGEGCTCGWSDVDDDPKCREHRLVDCECGHRHLEGWQCAGQPIAGWRETSRRAERDDLDYHEDQDGAAYSRRWEQPHPSGFGTLLTTITSWAQDDGARRWIVTETEWAWINDTGVRLFEDYNLSDSYEDGPSGEPWPTPEDVRRNVDDIRQPDDPDETPLADILDASLCPGGCGTWVVDRMCSACENRRELPAAPETPASHQGTGQHDPAPEQDAGQHHPDLVEGPASSTDTGSGSAAHQEGPPVSQPTVINPDIVDATGALACAEGALKFTREVRHQMEILGANAQRHLGDVPAVREIRMYEAKIAATASVMNALVQEHIEHVITQADINKDESLKLAAVGYLDARHRA